jgi:hypothetical protein
MLAPIVLFVYNRPEHTLKTLTALSENELAKESILYIFADGPKTNSSSETLERMDRTRQIIRSKEWCAEVHVVESAHNRGLADSVIGGVTEIVNKYGKVIVLEDDLLTSKGFLRYMNTALDLYKDRVQVRQIAGHFFPINEIKAKNSSFFLPLTTSWGWATWKRAWDTFDPQAIGYEKLKTDSSLARRFDLDNSYPYSTMLIDQMETGKVNSWAIRWWWTVFVQNGLSLFPDKSLVENIGFGNEGTHTTGANPHSLDHFYLLYEIIHFPNKAIPEGKVFKQLKLYLAGDQNRQHNHPLILYLSKLKRLFRYVLGYK